MQVAGKARLLDLGLQAFFADLCGGVTRAAQFGFDAVGGVARVV